MKQYLVLIITNSEAYNQFRAYNDKIAALERLKFERDYIKRQSLATLNSPNGVRNAILLDISNATIVEE